MIQVEEFPSGLVQAKGYLLWDEESMDAAIIDYGGPNNALVEFIHEKELTLKFVLITHAHHDHILGLWHLKQFFPEARVFCHESDSELWAGTKLALEISNPSRAVPIMFPDNFLEGPDVYFTEEQVFLLGNSEIKSKHTPGHTPGGVCYYVLAQSICFVGDTINARGIGLMCFPGHSWDMLKRSLEQITIAFRDGWTLFPAHSETFALKDALPQINAEITEGLMK